MEKNDIYVIKVEMEDNSAEDIAKDAVMQIAELFDIAFQVCQWNLVLVRLTNGILLI